MLSHQEGDCATFGGSDPLLTFQTKSFAVTSFGHQPKRSSEKKNGVNKMLCYLNESKMELFTQLKMKIYKYL